MIRTLLILTLLSVLPLGANAQLRTNVLSDSAMIAEYREKIGLDYSMPDYSVTSIDEKKIGSRLANILRYYEEVNQQNMLRRKIAAILVEQNEVFEYASPEFKKQKLVKIEKSADEITVVYKLWLEKNPASLKHVDIKYHFKDGVSESNTVNEYIRQLRNSLEEEAQNSFRKH